jgi:hypothetical protein
MSNPYAPPPPIEADERKFQIRESVAAAGKSMKVGLLCSLLSGCLLEFGMEWIPVSLTGQLALPGLVLGIGVAFAAHRAMPQARKWMLLIFPLFALLSFACMGTMYYVGAEGHRQPSLRLWRDLVVATFPAVLILALGCLLIARPRSYRRFVLFVIATNLLVGGAPVLAELALSQVRDVPVFFMIMFVVQILIFAMIGWIFGDMRPYSSHAVSTNPTTLHSSSGGTLP